MYHIETSQAAIIDTNYLKEKFSGHCMLKQIGNKTFKDKTALKLYCSIKNLRLRFAEKIKNWSLSVCT